jgi:hypothetical protein
MQGEHVLDEFGQCDRQATLNAAWQAPWRPLSKFFKFNYQRQTISFDYQRMRDDEVKAMRLYYQAAARLGSKLNLRVVEGVEPDFQITTDLGSAIPYLNNIKIADAAMAGDPWLLGFIDEPNPGLAEILGYNSRGMAITSYEPPSPAPVVTPAQVLAMPDEQMMQMIAQMAATAAAAAVDRALDAREAQKRAEKGQALRDAKAAKRGAAA